MSNIQDVATLAGVSAATVSRVLNGHTHVSKSTADKVRKAVAELGFHPNQAAKVLRTSKASRLIMTVPNITNIFFSSIIRAAQEAARAADYALLLGEVGANGEYEDMYSAMIERREADGIIFLGRHLPTSLAEMINSRGTAAPVVNGCEYTPDMPVCSVHIDQEAAGADGANHLYDLGHRRIGILTGDMGGPISVGRLAGVRRAAKARGLDSELIVVNGDYSAADGTRLTHQLLSQPKPPTAIFAFSDDMALGAIHAIYKTGRSCPGDVSVVGFDDIHLSEHLNPALTTIRQPMASMGKRSVELLIRILNGEVQEREIITLNHKLIVRDSTAAPRT